MPVQPIPPPFEHFGQRPFSFYPPILNLDHNEWIFRRATWSEVLVANTKTGEEIWISRRFIGDVSRIDEPVMILGLTKELEYKMGQVLPAMRRVIEIPRAVNEGFRPMASDLPVRRPAHVVGIRLEGSAESRIGKMIAAVLVVGVVGCFALVNVFRTSHDGSRISYSPVVQSDLGLTSQDDYFAVVRKLGPPAEDRWRSDKGELQYRVLTYPQQGLSVILMGSDRSKARYIGALDRDWHPVDAVSLPGGGTTASMLRALPKF
jgi:hypothetical protein